MPALMRILLLIYMLTGQLTYMCVTSRLYLVVNRHKALTHLEYAWCSLYMHEPKLLKVVNFELKHMLQHCTKPT